MVRIQPQLLTWFTVAVLLMVTAATSVRAQNGLKTIDNPGGGQIVYGPLTGQSSLREAMGTVLREIHGHFGDRPQIGRFFKARNSDSVATFITLTAKAQGGKRIAGLVIVSMPTGVQPAAAWICDEADRFGKTAGTMLKKLGEVWHPDSARPERTAESTSSPAAPSASGPEPAGEALPLHETSFPDNSGSIGLPEGWQITLAARGGVHAAGPRGEAIHLGVIIMGINDPNNPHAQRTMQSLNRMGKPYLVCPYGGDLVDAYRAIAQQNHQISHTPAPTLTVANSSLVQSGPYGTASVLVVGELDNHDGKGPHVCSIRIASMREGALGQWGLAVNGVTVPKQLAESEWPTMKAIVSSWRQNGVVIQKQTDDVIGRIHKIGDETNERIARAHAANDAHNAAIEKMWDNQDKYSKSFQNYQLDQAVVQNNETGQHKTLDLRDAATLVQQYPDRYQYVNTPEFLKGIDY